MTTGHTPHTDEATQALMAKLLKDIEVEKAAHSLVINALANLAGNFAFEHTCCKQSAGRMFLQIGTDLVGGSVMVAIPSGSKPPSAPVH